MKNQGGQNMEEPSDKIIHLPQRSGATAQDIPAKSTRAPNRRTSANLDSSVTRVTKKIKTDEALSQTEGLKRFNELDRLIVSGLTQSLVVSRALRDMEQGQYYIVGGYKTIAEYGSKIMKLAESTVHQYVNTGRVAKLIDDSTDCRVKPFNQAQLRPLLNVDDDEKVIEIWNAAAMLNGGGGLTEKAVASAKRQVLKQEPTKPKSIGVEEVAKKLHKAIRRGWDACQGEQGKLLGNLLVLLKGFFDELKYDERSPRLTAVFKDVDDKPPQVDEQAAGPPTETTVLPAEVPATKSKRGQAVANETTAASIHPEKVHERQSDSPTIANGSNDALQAERERTLWDKLNWRLTNVDLADVWKLKYNTVKQMRCRQQRGTADKRNPEAYQQAIKLEKTKALGFSQSSTEHQA